MAEEGSVRRFRSQLTAMLPEGWCAKESINLAGPEGQADIVASSEPLDPGVDTKHYAEAQGELLRKEYSGYRELAFMPYRMLGDLEGFVRRFEWTPSKPAGPHAGLKGLIRSFELMLTSNVPITTLQLYYAGNGRGYTVTATTHSDEFEHLESQLWEVLNGLALEGEHPAPAPDRLHSRELRNFAHSTIETYLRENDYPFFRDKDDNFQLKFLPDKDSGRELNVRFSAEGSENAVYAIYIYADKTIPRSDWNQALLLCNTWNAQKRWPRVCLWVDNPNTDTTAQLIMDHHIDLEPGIDQELFNNLTNTVIHFAFEFWKWASQDWVWQNITDISRLGPEVFTASPDASTNSNSDSEESEAAGGGSEEADNEMGPGDSYRGEDVLGTCGVSLTDRAQQGRLGHSDRQGALVERVIAALAAEGPSSIMLVGRPDVGKTALMHEVVRRMHTGNVPPTIRGREVWFVTANNLIAGMKYIGEWQGRARNLVLQAQGGRQILYMGDPGEILAAGRHSQSDDNLGRFLRPYIEGGELTVVCECTPEAYGALTKTEPSFMRAFRRIDVPEANEADTAIVLEAAARRLEETRGIAIEPEATNAVLELTRRFMPYQAFPGKAVRLLEALVQDALQATAGGGGGGVTVQTFRRADAIAGFARATGLPAFMLSDEVAMRVPEVRAHFEERLLGQPDAVEAMVDLITVVKADLTDPGKPLGSFFFVGPTGVGKTELAKILAGFLFGDRQRLLRFDMSEYASGDALARLIGSAWDGASEGELTRRVREQPFCVVLLDEFEKAHPAVFDVLLGVLGEGRLTGADGRTTDFRNAIVIMTSNLGASRGEMQPVGFGASNASADTKEGDGQLEVHFLKEAERFFRPEFFNRIDRIVAFRPLSLEAIRQITRRELGKLLMREGVVRRKLLVEIDDAVIEELLTHGFHPLYGARPLQREIERAVILPLARLVVEKNPDGSHLLRFDMRGGRIQLELTPLDATGEKTSSATAPAPPPRRKLESDLDKVLDDVRDLRERSTTEEANPVVGGLRREKSELLERTYAPTFWDNPATAREVLGRVYHTERVLKRLDALAARAERLEEKGRQIRIHRDRRSVPSFAQEVEDLRIQFDYLQAELTGAGEGHDQAIVCVAPVSRDFGPWAARLLTMYTAWAKRKGYEYGAFDTSPPSEGTTKEAPPASSALYLKGSNVYELLRGEAGLHKLSSGTAEDRRRELARVTVLPAQDVPVPDDPVKPHAALTDVVRGRVEAHDENDASAFVRIYHEGRERFVRDPRTGVRLTDVSSVLEDGRIDEFLLAGLRWSRRAGST